MKKRVILTHPLFPAIVQRHFPAARFEVRLAQTSAKLLTELPKADALITLLSLRIDEKLLKQATRLRVVGNFAVGVNNIDFEACARRVPEGEALCRSKASWQWLPDMLLGQELGGRNAVIVGGGRIGLETAKLFRAIGLRVQLITRQTPRTKVLKLLQKAQVLSLHLPLTPETRHWLNGRKLALLPKDAIVINTSRGAVIDERALISALRARRIFGAGLDVYEHEPRIPPALRKLGNVVLLPHLGSATAKARQGMAELVCSGVAGLLDGKRIPNEVKFR